MNLVHYVHTPAYLTMLSLLASVLLQFVFLITASYSFTFKVQFPVVLHSSVATTNCRHHVHGVQAQLIHT